MHRFWEPVLRPLMEGLHPANIIEIGADAGINTQNLLAYCRENGAVLHSIDPEPGFDVDQLQKRYGEAFRFHRGLSLNVLYHLEHFDVVLIDGDHNWYTVYHELKLIEKKFCGKGWDFPLVILHDTSWPYARRDLYYDPENIPGEFLKPYAKKGILPGRAELVEEEGLNPHLYNSIYENDLQNGVLTAIEDFLGETAYSLEFYQIQGMNGLGLLVPSPMRKQNEALARILEEFSMATKLDAYIRALEHERIGKELDLNRTRRDLRLKAERDLEKLKAAREAEAEKFRERIAQLQQTTERLNGENRGLKHSVGELKDQLAGELSDRKKEEARLKALLRDKEQEAADYQKRLQRAEKEVASLSRWLDKYDRQVQHLLGSSRWRVGNRIGEAWQKLLLRPRRPTAVDHIQDIRRQVQARKTSPQRQAGQTSSTANHPGQAADDEEKYPPDSVTVLVTVYNAYEDARACIESVLEKTTPPYRMIILDDASTDERIWPMLQSCERAHTHVVAQRNEKNCGYTATINKGCRMAGSDDVVLLNSDTVVTSGWLEKLRACAAGKANVATVTPLSNAAGAFSVPRNNRVNSLPDSMSIEDMARLVETLSPGIRPEVPTGNGFCMYVTRRALEQVGGFDEANFPRGYGEENDFCMRAMRKGFVHLIDDATFIFHKRSASFGDKKREVIAESTKRLRALHPGYKGLVSQWLKNDPLDDFRARLQKVIGYKSAHAAKTSLKSGRPVVLYILHSGGGGVLHTGFDLFYEAAKNYHCFLLQTGLTRWRLYEAEHGSRQVVNEFRFSGKWRIHEPLSEERQRVIKEIASICSPDVVHIRHFLGNHPAVASLFREMGCRVVFSIHDFYTICPTIQLVDNEGRFCEGVCSADGGDCDCAKNWFASMPPLKNGFVLRWRRTVADALKACDALVVTSGTTRDLIQRHYPFLGDSMFHLIEHGRDFSDYRQCAAFPEPGNPMRTVYFGVLGMNKGGPLVKGMLEYNRRVGHPVEMHILGTYNLPFRPGRLGSVYHGAYEREKLPEKLYAIQPSVAIIPSVWPETYCHTLTEAWRAGIPVLGSDLGAVGERILRHGGGWILPPQGPEKWVDKLVAIAVDQGEYQEKIADIRAMRFKTVAEMGAEYGALYSRVLEDEKQEPKADAG